MTPESYALSLAQKGHTAQSILMATGVSIEQVRPAPRREFVYTPMRPPAPPPPPAVYTGERFGPPAPTVRLRYAAEIARVAQEWGVSIEDMTGRCRKARPSLARHALMYILYTHHGLSYPRIGRLLNRHHTTVLSGVIKYCRVIGVSYSSVSRPWEFDGRKA